MKKLVIYVHGKGGSAIEALHYKNLFIDFDVLGFDYKAQNPWEAREEFAKYFDSISKGYEEVHLIANSIGAYFSMMSLSEKNITQAYFISPMVNMEKLINDMMLWANVREQELKEKKIIATNFGENLSWDYLCYVRENPVCWKIPTHILYGTNDNLVSLATMQNFVEYVGTKGPKPTLTIMEGGEHWFHTEEQMNFLDKWIKGVLN